MRAFGVVSGEIIVEWLLHLVDGFDPCPSALDPEALVQQRALQAFVDAVRLRAPDACLAVLDVLQLQEEFVWVLIWAPAELPAMPADRSGDHDPINLLSQNSLFAAAGVTQNWASSDRWGICAMCIRILAVLLALWFGLVAVPQARAESVDLLLALVSDVSRSIDDQEFELQKKGYFTAMTDRRVIAAIQGGVLGRVVINYVEFAGGHEVKTVIGWTIVHDTASARAFAEAVRDAPRSYSGRTAISSGILHAMKEMESAGHEATRRVIDVCGDGTSNAGPPLDAARDLALAAGITVNGLVILSEPNWPGNEAHVRPPGGLRKYYEDNVIGGTGSFALEAHNFQSFGKAMTRKLITEISNFHPVPAKKMAAR
ncbi:MAG: DUF1194 domain-containing protein [Acetobacteraceae bacterium]|nr:DUF1194 domain-containing protein [Acetobacteraceae bacterium]